MIFWAKKNLKKIKIEKIAQNMTKWRQIFSWYIENGNQKKEKRIKFWKFVGDLLECLRGSIIFFKL